MTKVKSEELSLSRRANNDRRGNDRRKAETPVDVERRATERRTKVPRRRQIDPTTCERDYSDDEVEFMNALEQYKRANGRMFPTCSEVLEVIRSLGYAKQIQIASRAGEVNAAEASASTTTPVTTESIPQSMTSA